jgi:flagellar basal-body rod protein FlgB
LPTQGDLSVLHDTTQIALHRTIIGAGARTEALAANLANANTPGYQRVDVDFHGALARAMGTGSPADALKGTTFAAETTGAGAVRADGSTVDVDAESAKLAANALEYQAAVGIAHARTAILRSAMGVG